jgi:hypothetical protein
MVRDDATKFGQVGPKDRIIFDLVLRELRETQPTTTRKSPKELLSEWWKQGMCVFRCIPLGHSIYSSNRMTLSMNFEYF